MLCGDAQLAPDGLGPLTDDFAGPVREMLDRSVLHPTIQPDDPDPVVGPPFYGSYASGADTVPIFGWMPVLNLAPAPRMAAGLGAEVVRRNQERFMALAWQQAGEIREANRELSFTRLQGEIGAAWKRRIDKLDPLARVAVTRSQLSFVRDGQGLAPRALLGDSSFPGALVSPAFRRAVRPGFVTAKAAARRNPEHPLWYGALGSTFGAPRSRRQMSFGKPVTPAGMRFADSRHHGEPLPDPGIDPGIAGTFDLDDTATLASGAIAPAAAGRSRLAARIPALVEIFAAIEPSDTPTRVTVGPVIDEALMWSLVEMSPELLAAGCRRFPEQCGPPGRSEPGVRRRVHWPGANHEMTRELLVADLGQRGEPGRRAVRLADGDGPVEPHDRGVGEAEQLVVPLDDLHPIGLRRRPGASACSAAMAA